MRIGYVLKMYPRFSETFILNEILAHEAVAAQLQIFSLRPPRDGRFHEALARVRAPVHYLKLPTEGVSALADRMATPSHVDVFWTAINDAGVVLPDLWAKLETARGEKARDVFQAVNLARMVREQDITHLHAHFGSLATTVARLAAHFADVPYTFTAHAKDLFHASVQPADLRRKLRDAAVVITVSDFNVAFLHENYGPAAERVTRIYNGIDLQMFGFQSPIERPPLIAGVGRLIEKKGFADLIAACAVLRERGRRFGCQIIGSGPQEPALRDQIERSDLAAYVELLGPRPQGDVRALVQRAAVFAAPCVIGSDGNRDGLPTVLLEAMALGTPCVSTDVTGIPEVLHDERTGLLVPQHDAAALAAAIERLLDDVELRSTLARNARRLIEDEFDIARNTARIRDVFVRAQTRTRLAEVT